MDILSQIYGSDDSIATAYGTVPGSKLLPILPELCQSLKLSSVESDILTAKVTQWCKRLFLMHLAGEKTIRREDKFIIRQNHEEPTLTWQVETEIFYHVAAMHLFARCALDSMAHVATALLLDDRGWDVPDRFFEFSQRIKTMTDQPYDVLNEALLAPAGKDWSWFRILCGTEQGRALHNQCKFQKIARIEYLENRPENEREGLFAVIKSIDSEQAMFIRIPLLELVHTVRQGVVGFAVKLEDLLVQKF